MAYGKKATKKNTKGGDKLCMAKGGAVKKKPAKKGK